MKNIKYTIILFFFLSINSFGQNTGGVPFPIKSQGSNSVRFATDYGQWSTIDVNNPQIKARSRIIAYHNPNQWFWEIEFKNTGNRKVFFAWLMAGTPQALNQKYPNMSFGSANNYSVLEPNAIRKDEITNGEYDNINHSLYVKIHSVCYDFKAGTNESICKLEETNNSNSYSSTSTSSMNRGGNVVSGNSTNTNSEGTGWNSNNGDSNISIPSQQELNKQQYNNTVNKGITNLQNGNYTDAIQNYSNALNTATTKSEKNIATTGIVVSSIGGVFDAIAKEKEEQRIKEEQLRLIKQKNEAIAKEEMEKNWKIANENANLKNTEGYKKAIDIMLPYANANKINGMALNKIGDWYNNLNDINNAIKWYEKAIIKDNHSCAMHNLGSFYELGKGVTINLDKALELYQQSCKKDDDTGCKMYEKLKSKIDSEVEVAKKKISSFNLKNCVDYLVLQCEKSGFKYDNITKYCINDLSKKISVSFNKNNKILAFNFVVEYNNTMSKIDRVLNYTVDSDLLIDFSKLQLSSLIGNEKISEKYVSGFFELLQSTPKQGNLNGIKSTKYKGFEKETTIKNDNNLEAFLHNAAISCNSDEANSWLAKAGDAGNFECYKTIFYNQLNNKNTNHSYASKYILKYIEAIEIKLKSENNVKTELIKELDNLAYDIFEANKNYEIEERKYNKYNYYLEKYSICIKKIADLDGHKAIKYTGLIYEKGMGLNKNYEQAVYYYSKLTNDPEAMCKIANLYKTGGDKNFNVFKKNKKLAKEWKLKSKNAGGVCN